MPEPPRNIASAQIALLGVPMPGYSGRALIISETPNRDTLRFQITDVDGATQAVVWLTKDATDAITKALSGYSSDRFELNEATEETWTRYDPPPPAEQQAAARNLPDVPPAPMNGRRYLPDDGPTTPTPLAERRAQAIGRAQDIMNAAGLRIDAVSTLEALREERARLAAGNPFDEPVQLQPSAPAEQDPPF